MADLSEEALSEYYEIVSNMFGSEDEGFQFYNNYALEKGSSVRKSYVEWDNDNRDLLNLRKFVCSREGFRESKYMKNGNRKRKARNISRVGCRARLVVAQVKETGWWYVKDFIDEHNHPLATQELACMLRSHRRICEEQKVSIVEMEISRILKHQIMDILEMRYGGFDIVGCTDRDIYNFSYSYKRETIAAARQDKDPEFFFTYLVDADGHLNGLFWSDSQSLLDYEAFGDVVIFDSRCRTNRYNMPFVPFVGLNHYRSTVIFGCGIISHETSEAYEWMLQTFSADMAQKHPISVITDGDLAMQRAIRVVWPNSNHRLCGCEFKEDCLYGISGSCRKLECIGTPCSHIFYVLRILEVDELLKCCIPDRWTMSAKSASPPTRKNNMYDYSTSLGRYRELRNLSHATSSRASQCIESFPCFKRVLQEEASSTLSNVRNERMRYGPVLPQMVQVDSAKVLDPLHVKGQGALRKD
ncbi:hypothetical protein GQ55_5G369600 [Panicum hallii var. hallii]|uniref:Uncharacterized protein n=1 Tax=Panicum hallii var. hallii TaxID=1504633 RepID=A0A2T7DMM0_9POAL|nr:hypothetical protein GQ55_5G369600 [Panicum hallii var. hallii]